MNKQISETNLEALALPLLRWWDEHKADLPWRESKTAPTCYIGERSGEPDPIILKESQDDDYSSMTGKSAPTEIDPYAIWVAEVMLQQTQVNTVIPYYRRWMERFPTVDHLVVASLDEVLIVWQGLGYYSRARNLHRSANLIVSDFGGQLPETVDQLQDLPGIGRYTAGAIASIAFGQKAAAVDGNVIRVISRLVDYPDDVTVRESNEELWSLAEQAVPASRPGDFNQALMELGQRICLVKNPHCSLCPLKEYCTALKRGTQLQRPVRPKRARAPHYHVTAAVIMREDGRLLITQRPLDGLLGGLWEFPGGKVEEGETLSAALMREIAEELAVKISVGAELTTIKHAYTHCRITLHALSAKLLGGRIQHLGVIDHAWVTLKQMDKYAFAATDLKIIDHLVALEAQRASMN